MELFGELYDRYGDKVFRKVISMVKDREVSKDLTQEILVKTFLKLADFQGKAKFSTWLFMITYNYCIDYIRKQKRIYEKEEGVKINYYDDLEDDGDEMEVLDMQIGRLKDLLEEIPPEDKTMLLMYYQDDMSVKELQDFFDLGASAVKMRLSRSRKKLKELYHETYESL